MRYLALGDSYTIGTGASSPEQAWPSIVAARLGAELTNPAVNGYTTEDLIRDELSGRACAPTYRNRAESVQIRASKPHV